MLPRFLHRRRYRRQPRFTEIDTAFLHFIEIDARFRAIFSIFWKCVLTPPIADAATKASFRCQAADADNRLIRCWLIQRYAATIGLLAMAASYIKD
jgi:hypothetical protein